MRLSQKHYAISDPPCNRNLQGPGEPAFLVTTKTNGQFQHLDSGAKHIGATNNFFGSIFTWSLDGTS